MPALSRSTTFFDREVIDRGARPWFSALLAFVGLGFCVWGGVQRIEALLIIGPLLLAWGFLFSLRHFRITRYRFTSTEVICNRPKLTLKYGEIEEVHAGPVGRNGNFPIHLFHAGGALVLSPRISCSSRELFDFLERQPLGVPNHPQVPELFANFLRQQQMICSPNDIRVIQAARQRPCRSSPQATLLFALGLMLPFPLWYGLSVAHRPWQYMLALGVTLLVVGAVLAMLVLLTYGLNRPRTKDWKNAILILTPEALAMEQGDLRGELRWRELESVKRSSGHFGIYSTTATAGLQLKVQGADIVIADVYERPLDYLETLIRQYAKLDR